MAPDQVSGVRQKLGVRCQVSGVSKSKNFGMAPLGLGAWRMPLNV